MRILSTLPSPLAARRARTVLFVSLTLVVVASLGAEAVAQQLATGRGRVRGRIVDSADAQVADAAVTFTYIPSGEVFEAEGDDNGVFVKGNMGFGAWRVDVIAAGYEDYSRVINLRNVGRDFKMEVVMTAGSSGGSGETALSSLFSGKLGEELKVVGALFEAGDYAGALAGYEGIMAAEATKENPNAEIHYVHLNAGNAAFEMADYAKAEEHYQALVAQVPDNIDGRLALAKTYMVERRTDEAIAALDGVDLSEVMDPFVFYNLGSMFFDQGQSAEAEDYYRRATERDPSFADAYMQLGLSMIQQGKMAEATPHLEKVLELAPGSENAALAQEFLALVQG